MMKDKNISNPGAPLPHLFFYFSHIRDHNCLYQSTPALFIQISAIIVNGTILGFLLRVKNICNNQTSPPLNHLSIFTCNHMAYFYLGNLFKGNKTNERQNIFHCPRRITMRSISGKLINNRHYVPFFYYCCLFPRIPHGIIIVPFVDMKIMLSLLS